MNSVFISYAREDAAAAGLVADRLKAAGVQVFLDRVGLVTGESWSGRLKAELDYASALVVLLSSNSRRTKWVEEEVQAAIESKKVVLPVLLDSGAKENWIWPLVGTREAFPLQVGSSRESFQVRAIVESLFSSSTMEPVSAPTRAESTQRTPYRARSAWRSVLLAAISAVVGVLATLYLRK